MTLLWSQIQNPKPPTSPVSFMFSHLTMGLSFVSDRSQAETSISIMTFHWIIMLIVLLATMIIPQDRGDNYA